MGFLNTPSPEHRQPASGGGSVAITEIHGNRLKLRCIECNARWPLGELPTDEVPPRCPHCKGIVKTDTVMFGEPIPLDALESCQRESRLCDCMLLVGTSAVVYPAAEFPVIAYRQGAKCRINPMETPLSDVLRRRAARPGRRGHAEAGGTAEGPAAHD
jgi:NAD-dependent deacetylase